MLALDYVGLLSTLFYSNSNEKWLDFLKVDSIVTVSKLWRNSLLWNGKWIEANGGNWPANWPSNYRRIPPEWERAETFGGVMEAKRERIELASGERRWWRATGVGGVGGRLTEPRSGRCAASLFTCWFNNNFISSVSTALVGATVFFF